MQAQPTTNDAIGLDPELRAFLRTVLSCQCLALAAWAAKILRAGWIDEAGLARCFNLGFDA